MEKLSKENMGFVVLAIYSLLNLKLVYPLVADSSLVFVLLDGSNLTSIFVFLFLNTILCLYWITEKRFAKGILTVYTFLNLKILYPLILGTSSVWLIAGITTETGRFMNAFSVFIGLFLNAALIVYWLRKNIEEHSKG